jgi:hypothetical protein
MQVQRQSCLLGILSGLFGVRQRFPENRAIVLSCIAFLPLQLSLQGS